MDFFYCKINEPVVAKILFYLSVIDVHKFKRVVILAFSNFRNIGVAMPDQTDYVWDQYEESLQMSTYLLAFIVSDFGYRTGLNLGTEFRIWSRKEAIEETKYAAEIGPKVLKYYETYFDIPFPLPKQDMIAIPDFSAGAMENWGMFKQV